MTCPSVVCNPLSEGGALQEPSANIKDGMKEFDLDNDTLKQVMGLFKENIERGLKKETHPDAIVKCFPTYVQDLPTGTEKGQFLALDLGGTNFRVLCIDLDVEKCDLTSDVFEIPHELMVGDGEPLFDYIAKCLADFVKKYDLQDLTLPLGFCFSFPLVQKGLKEGILVQWTKGFSCPDVVGQDVVKWLCDAIERQGEVNLTVCGVLNDTTGTLMSCAWKNPECRIGLIVGTGFNGCYLETQQNAEMFDEPDMGSGKVIINLEAAAFGDDGCLDFVRTDLDKLIDGDSINPGKQTSEKLISGMYLGELVRLYMLGFIKAGFMFGGNHADIFETPEVFKTSMISDIESDPAESHEKCSEILNSVGVDDASEQDMIDLRYICKSISTRSAHLAAAFTCVLMAKVGEPKLVIGVDGSVYKFHPNFRQLMKDKMTELEDQQYAFDLMLSEDGSGRGAALVAAMVAMRTAAE